MSRFTLLKDATERRRPVNKGIALGGDAMNVWQTIEAVSGNNLRKNYYDGYSDTRRVLRFLSSTCHQEISTPETVASPLQSELNDGHTAARKPKDEEKCVDIAQPVGGRYKNKPNKSRTKNQRNRKDVHIRTDSGNLFSEDTDLVKCSFNIPRISAELERILGTNVIRLTDRHYMKQLRARVEADFAIRLSKRIRSREVKELERERNLILEGKTDQVPDELASDPVFVVNKRAGIEIAKRRANLRTSREKCAERLIRQAEKWKRERERYQEEEALKQQKLKQRKVYQAELERKYAKENAKLGLNLLRINDTEWQPCEQDLRDFLENERMKIKERAERESMPFSSDPLDIVNVMRERKKRLEEARIQRREQRRLQKLQVAAKSVKKQKPAAKKTASKEVQKKTSTAAKKADAEETATIYLDDDEASGIPSSPEPSLMKKPVKGPNVVEIEQQTDVDAQKQGYLVTVDQYNNLRYQDKTLNKLHATPNIKELYALAERIVICDIEEEALPEEEEEEID